MNDENRKLKTLRLVRFGEVFYDQQKRLLVLCRSCQRHYLAFDSFHTHLSKCTGVKHIVNSIEELHYDEQKRETRLLNGKQEVYIYEPSAVGNRNSTNRDIDWEAELEDPRWYTDDSRTQSNKAKQQPTNAKENVAKNHTIPSRNSITMKMGKPMYTSTTEPPSKRLCVSTPMRTILANQQQHKSAGSTGASVVSTKFKNDVIVPQKRNGTMKPPPTTAAMATSPAEVATSPAVIATSATAITTMPATGSTSVTPTPIAAAASGDTQKILNKLRACGVEVKVRNPRENKQVDEKKQLALEIMRKLQSNGIKCTKVSNTKS